MGSRAAALDPTDPRLRAWGRTVAQARSNISLRFRRECGMRSPSFREWREHAFLLPCIPSRYTIRLSLIFRVELSKEVVRQLRRVPRHIVVKLLAWVDDVETRGLDEVRKVPGFNDHPLKGQLAGRRAIRLSKQWRAIYVEKAEGAGEFVLVEEVHAHDY